MTVKTITITTDAYEALRALKGQNESFSKTILRLTGSRSLHAFAGMLSMDSAARLEGAVREGRNVGEEEHKRRLREIMKAFKRKDRGGS